MRLLVLFSWRTCFHVFDPPTTSFPLPSIFYYLQALQTKFCHNFDLLKKRLWKKCQIIIIIIIIMYLSWSWATCWPIPVSRIHKSLQRSTVIPSASWGGSISLPWVIHFEALYLHVASSFSCIPIICPKICVIFNSFAICAFVL